LLKVGSSDYVKRVFKCWNKKGASKAATSETPAGWEYLKKYPPRRRQKYFFNFSSANILPFNFDLML